MNGENGTVGGYNGKCCRLQVEGVFGVVRIVVLVWDGAAPRFRRGRGPFNDGTWKLPDCDNCARPSPVNTARAGIVPWINCEIAP
jgi:hypothetical protein